MGDTAQIDRERMTNSPVMRGKKGIDVNATVDQKLLHFARNSQSKMSDSATRFVTFEGEQIVNQKMSISGDN